MEKNIKQISFIIPCYGSEKTVGNVIDEIIKTVAQKKEYDYEIVAVNDQSPDNVLNVLKELAKKNNKIKVINLAKNMNRPGAVMAGLSMCSGDYVVVMDDDGQCPVDNLWQLITPLEEGHDVSIAKYTEYKQSIFKSFGTIVNRKMTEYIMDKPKDLNFTNFMALRKYIVTEILKYKNPYPYMTGLLLRTTNDFVSVEMEERSRIAGSTTFTFKKLINLWLNGFTAFSVKPLRLSTFMGTFIAFLGFIYGIFIIVRKIVNPANILAGYSSLLATLLFVSGIIMIILGVIGEYVGRIYICINNSPQFTIKEAINFKEAEDEKNK